MQRRHQSVPLDQSLTEKAERLRKEARCTPPGIERERLILQARQAESAVHIQEIQEWLTSPSAVAQFASASGPKKRLKAKGK
jgi:hypothetical protein